VTAFGGDITVDSTLGEGSKFKFTWPVSYVEFLDDFSDQCELSSDELSNSPSCSVIDLQKMSTIRQKSFVEISEHSRIVAHSVN